MEVIHDVPTFRKACDEARSRPGRVGFVPTMGSLHEGHASLIRAARERCGTVAISIFVNPLQFGSSEDLATYPRDLEGDLAVAEKEGVDLVFAPGGEEMYPSGAPQVTVDPGPVGAVLEGASRPGHFRGVLTVVAKLFGMVGACEAFFGQKDYQQLWLIRRMRSDLDLPVEVKGCPTVREPDGLAMSSRNVHLSPQERPAATCLFRALSGAVETVEGGEREAGEILARMRQVVDGEPLVRLDYASIVSDSTFMEIDFLDWDIRAHAVIAAWIGATRLIDNMELAPRMAENP